ncbi:MAG: 30S ribosomal protein S9 [Candidatus Brocadiia bacterium]
MTETSVYRSLGRRKSATAQVVLQKGTGKITINDLEYTKYFNTQDQLIAMLSPLQSLKLIGKYDIKATTNGGGKRAQADAVALGISRSLKLADLTTEPLLRKLGLFTRDPRMKERKKYGRRGARRSFQFSKR